MLKKIFLAITTFIVIRVSAQSQINIPKIKDDSSITNKIYRNINKDFSNDLFKQCGTGFFFLKFCIDDKGSVVNIMASKGVPKQMDSLIKRILISTNGQWVGSNNNIPFLLPVIYGLGNCDKENNLKKNPETVQEMLDALPNINAETKTGIYYSLLHMIDFAEDTSITNKGTILNCFILEPILITRPRI